MQIIVTDKAQKWYHDELGLKEGDTLKIFGKYGGSTNIHVGFSTGIAVAEPVDPLASVVEEGITYFTEKSDEWFFTNYLLTIDLDETLNEPSYIYQEQ